METTIIALAAIVLIGVVVIVLNTRHNRQIADLQAQLASRSSDEALKQTIEIAAQRVAEKQVEALNKRNEEFRSASSSMFDSAMKRLNESLETSRKENVAQSERFSTEMKMLRERTAEMEESANRLSNALKSDSKVQGDWGESYLRQILENSGLEEGRHFQMQVAVKDAENSNYRPDCVVHCPGKGDVIIDSKVTFTALDRYKSAETEDERKRAIKEIHESVKKHVDELSGKAYHKMNKDFYENVIMFVPIKETLYLASLFDPNLLNYANQKGVWVVDNTSLLSIVSLVKSMWVFEDKDKNVERVLDEAGKLYEKFVTFSYSFKKIGDALNSGATAYDEARGQLIEGPGNVVKKLSDLQNLGAKIQKDKPIEPKLLEMANSAEDRVELRIV